MFRRETQEEKAQRQSRAVNHTRSPRILAQASELAADQRYCTCCQKPLKAKFAYLELDQRTDTYHDFGNVPQDRSQGWFPFGMTCAKNELVKHNATVEGKAA